MLFSSGYFFFIELPLHISLRHILLCYDIRRNIYYMYFFRSLYSFLKHNMNSWEKWKQSPKHSQIHNIRQGKWETARFFVLGIVWLFNYLGWFSFYLVKWELFFIKSSHSIDDYTEINDLLLFLLLQCSSFPSFPKPSVFQLFEVKINLNARNHAAFENHVLKHKPAMSIWNENDGKYWAFVSTKIATIFRLLHIPKLCRYSGNVSALISP